MKKIFLIIITLTLTLTLTLTIITFLLINFTLLAQVENVPVSNPVYNFLLRAETKGLLPHYSLSILPWQKHTVISALKLIRENDSLLSENEKNILNNFEREFEIVTVNRAVMFYSEMDTVQVFSKKMFSDYEKAFYHYADSNKNVTVHPLASLDIIDDINSNNSLLMGTLGIRLFGTLTNNFGYYLQVTNTAMLKGDSVLALLDNKYAHNIKFTKYNSDADIAESHVAYQNKWFYASLGRETKLNGSGLLQRIYVNDLSPAFDAITVAAKFKTFEYVFSHNSLLGLPSPDHNQVGVDAVIPNKYLVMHNYIFKPKWGEISIFESVTYSRDFEFAYIVPLSFIKSLEHARHDRDRANIGLNGTFRPINNFQIKGTWYLDDIKFSEIGKNYWSNKTAWNIAVITSMIKNIDLGLEYSRVEPYTFTHFNQQNAATNDSILFSSYILPNSDRWSIFFQYWWGQRYPIKLNISYTRHGNNIYDEEGNLIFNAGGDPLQTTRWGLDSDRVDFLGGDLVKFINAEFTVGYEFIRNFSIHFSYNLKAEKDIFSNYYRLILRFSDF